MVVFALEMYLLLVTLLSTIPKTKLEFLFLFHANLDVTLVSTKLTMQIKRKLKTSIKNLTQEVRNFVQIRTQIIRNEDSLFRSFQHCKLATSFCSLIEPLLHILGYVSCAMGISMKAFGVTADIIA